MISICSINTNELLIHPRDIDRSNTSRPVKHQNLSLVPDSTAGRRALLVTGSQFSDQNDCR